MNSHVILALRCVIPVVCVTNEREEKVVEQHNQLEKMFILIWNYMFRPIVAIMMFLYQLRGVYTGCPRRNVQYFGRVFLMLNYTDITQNTYIQSRTVTEIMAREAWNFDSCYTLIDYQIHIETGRNM